MLDIILTVSFTLSHFILQPQPVGENPTCEAADQSSKGMESRAKGLMGSAP